MVAIATHAALRDLESFVAPLTLAEFFRAHWGSTPLVTSSADEERLGPILALLPSWNVGDILATYPSNVTVWHETIDGEYRALLAKPSDAVGLYDAGMTLYLQAVPGLAALADGFAAKLGLPRARVQCGLFASRKSRGVRCHFDRNENFTVQIRGEKTWRIAPNEHVDGPIDNWVTTMPLDEDVRLATHRVMPTSLPEPSELVHLAPGSMFYLPRGYWHETASDTDSLSLNITCNPLMWGELLLPAIRAVLLGKPAWRAKADGATGSAAQREAAATHLAPLLAKLGTDLDALDARAVLDLPPFPRRAMGEARFRRNVLTSFGIERMDDDGEANVAFLTRASIHVRRSEATLAREFVNACIWIASRDGAHPFTAEDVAASIDGVSHDEATDLLELLVGTGFVLASGA